MVSDAKLPQRIGDKTMGITREEAKELLPIVKALAEGKMIQYKIEGLTDWVDTDEINLEFEDQKIKHRIKPEPKHRPFKNQEECWNEMLKHQPFGWIKSPNGDLSCIDRVFDEGVTHRASIFRFEDYLDGNYSFADGTPFGIKEE